MSDNNSSSSSNAVNPNSTWTNNVMTTPHNCIEYFGPEEFPMRAPRNHTEHDVSHMMGLAQLFEVRRELCHFGPYSCRFLGGLEKVLSQYTSEAQSCLERVGIFHKIDLHGIDKSIAAQRAKMVATRSFCLSPYSVKAKLDVAKTKKALVATADALLAKRKGEVLEARELMHRQLIMNAFFTSQLSWKASRFAIKGVRQGCLARGDINAYQLTKHCTGHNDGVYRLKLQWIPFAGATKYPVNFLIDRVGDTRFDLEDIEWANYEGPGNEMDLHPRFQPRTVPIIVRLRCSLVANEQRKDRVAIERDEMAEKAYKRALPVWKKFTYKAGDHRAALSSEKAKSH